MLRWAIVMMEVSRGVEGPVGNCLPEDVRTQ